jgi:7,8-dihydropterin-6-yl-methyl-4-(beta-D-ribofuranosyl)aminobenzene 5'-phosphate synthase
MMQITCLDNDCVSMRGGFWGEHGLSFLIEIADCQILFDTGTSAEILSHNLDILDKDLHTVTHLVLSHGHRDHTGSLEWALQKTNSPTLVADPLVFENKVFRNKKSGEIRSIGSPITRDQAALRASLMLTAEEFQVAPGVYVTGRIPRRTEFEKIPNEMLVERDGVVSPDSLEDDRSIVITGDRGLVVVCGCCHAGLINTLLYVREHHTGAIHAILGGIHLVGASHDRIESTIHSLKYDFKPETLYLNHCTGNEAYFALQAAFGEAVKPYPAGMILEF